MPRILLARRSGWKGSSASDFSPVPRNLIGLPVTFLAESAAPPLESPSILVMMIPSIPSFWLNPSAAFTASCPVRASTTRSIS